MDMAFINAINGFEDYYINIYGVVYNSKLDRIIETKYRW